jgi:signal peptidase I
MAKQQPYKKNHQTNGRLRKRRSGEKKTTLGMIWEIVQTLLMAAVLVFCGLILYCTSRVENISMETTFTEGQLLMVTN